MSEAWQTFEKEKRRLVAKREQLIAAREHKRAAVEGVLNRQAADAAVFQCPNTDLHQSCTAFDRCISEPALAWYDDQIVKCEDAQYELTQERQAAAAMESRAWEIAVAWLKALGVAAIGALVAYVSCAPTKG